MWKQFIEAIRVMKLDYHTGAMHHYTSLMKNDEATLNLLLELEKSADLIEYEPIVHYLVLDQRTLTFYANRLFVFISHVILTLYF